MKLSNLLALMAYNDNIRIYMDGKPRIPSTDAEVYVGSVLQSYKYPRLMKRTVTFFYAVRDDLYIFII